MSTDRELLELASKAAYGHKNFFGDMKWNPLTDDGDALRLAVKLNIDIRFDTLPDGPYVEAVAMWTDMIHCDAQDLGNDAALATRRVIVRTAAAIGRSQ